MRIATKRCTGSRACGVFGAALLSLLTSSVPHAIAGDAPEGSFALRAKRIYPMTVDRPGPIDDAVMVVRDGRVVALGADIAPPADLPLIDLPDRIVCPGFVDAASGLVRPHTGPHSVGAGYFAVDAFDRYDAQRVPLSRGTTTAYLSPGWHRLIAGHGAVVKLAGEPEQRVLAADADLTINLGVFNPPVLIDPPFYASSDVAIEPARLQRPYSRLGTLLELRERLREASSPPERRVKLDFQSRALRDAIARKAPWRIQAGRGADIDQALALLRETGHPATLVGLSEGDLTAAELVRAGLPVIVRLDTPFESPAANVGGDPEALESSLRVAAALAEASQAVGGKLQFALSGAAHQAGVDLQMVARLALRGGLSREAALAAITRAPAEILGVGERVGSLRPGADADFVVLNDEPLQVGSHVLQTWVEGRRVYEVAGGEAVVIRGGAVWTGSEVIQGGSLLIEDGKVKAVGLRVPQPPAAHVVDAGPNSFITPGFIDAHGHLGLEGDRGRAGTEVRLDQAIGVATLEFERVARAGVTTVMLAPYEADPRGSRVTAIKTWGAGRDELVARPVSAVKFSLRGADPQLGINQIKEQLEAGKKYEESWKKYEEELKKWEEDRAKGVPTQDKDAPSPVVETETRTDPITGVWSIEISGAPLPQPQRGIMTLKLTGTTIEGRLRAEDSDEEGELTGSLTGNKVVIELDVETPAGKPRVEATLDREDHMSGVVKAGEMLTLNFEATRTDKSPVEFKVSRKRKRGKDNRPVPPKVDERLEPFRPLLAGKIPALVDAASAAEIRAAVKLLADEYKIPVVLLNAEGAADVADDLLKHKDQVGLVVPTDVQQLRNDKPYVGSADLSGRGLAVAFQSNSEDGARNLPLMGLFAVQQGLGGDAALRALTVDAARMYRIDDQVGSLAAGRDGDVLIFSGHPFDADSQLLRVFVGGREVPRE